MSNTQRAVELTPPGHADLPTRLFHLGNSFRFRFRQTGDLADIENAIFNTQRAVELTPTGSADLPLYLNNLGHLFQSRFGRTEDLTDIENAISNEQRAVELTPPGHARLPLWLINLGAHFSLASTIHKAPSILIRQFLLFAHLPLKLLDLHLCVSTLPKVGRLPRTLWKHLVLPLNFFPMSQALNRPSTNAIQVIKSDCICHSRRNQCREAQHCSRVARTRQMPRMEPDSAPSHTR